MIFSRSPVSVCGDELSLLLLKSVFNCGVVAAALAVVCGIFLL